MRFHNLKWAFIESEWLIKRLVPVLNDHNTLNDWLSITTYSLTTNCHYKDHYWTYCCSSAIPKMTISAGHDFFFKKQEFTKNNGKLFIDLYVRWRWRIIINVNIENERLSPLDFINYYHMSSRFIDIYHMTLRIIDR